MVIRMKNIILQHWEGDLNELAEHSIENIKNYANRIGSDYQLITGKPFNEKFISPLQKLYCLDESWDNYDQVIMLDPDVFVRKGLTKNVFEESGNGVHGKHQIRLKQKLVKLKHIKKNDPYWAGSIYKFDKKTRQSLRNHFPKEDSWMYEFNYHYKFAEEGIFSILASKAKISENYLDFKWNQCSYLPNPENAYMIHVRTKKFGMINGTWENGGKRPKIENYKDLIKEGLI